MDRNLRNRLVAGAAICVAMIACASATQAQQGARPTGRTRVATRPASPNANSSIRQFNKAQFEIPEPRPLKEKKVATRPVKEIDEEQVENDDVEMAEFVETSESELKTSEPERSAPATERGTVTLERSILKGSSGWADETTCDSCGECESCCRCCVCGPPGMFWVRDEYIGWHATAGHVPALVGTNPNGTLPSSQTLYGNQNYNGGYRSGNWLQGGMWFDECRQWGVQADYFFLGQLSSPYFASSDGDPILTRPFTNANNGARSDELVAFPGRVVGQIGISNYNNFAGAGASFRHNLCCFNDCCETPCNDGCGNCFQGQNCCRLDLLAGFRYYEFNDNLNIREQLTSIDQQSGSGVAVGTQTNLFDSFRTRNRFYGGELGLVATRYEGRWMVEGAAKVGLGTTQQIVTIDGGTTVSFPGQTTAVNQGGLLALSSNIGKYNHNSFTAIPQLSARLGFRITERITILGGYTAIYWNNVAAAGNQVNTNVNPNLVPPVTTPVVGPNQPSYSLHTSHLWLQGFTVGAEIYF